MKTFEQHYPHLDSWVQDGWIEMGRTDYDSTFIRVLDEGGMIWSSDDDFATIDHALAAADAAVQAWCRVQIPDLIIGEHGANPFTVRRPPDGDTQHLLVARSFAFWQVLVEADRAGSTLAPSSSRCRMRRPTTSQINPTRHIRKPGNTAHPRQQPDVVTISTAHVERRYARQGEYLRQVVRVGHGVVAVEVNSQV